MKVIILLLGCFLALPLLAGVSDGYYRDPGLRLGSLVNPDKINISHSLTFQSGVNTSGDGYYLNAYSNHLDFMLHPKLDLKIDLHFVNYGSMNIGNDFNIEGNNDIQTKVLPEFELEWRPSKNTKLNIAFQRGRGGPVWYDKDEYDFFDD